MRINRRVVSTAMAALLAVTTWTDAIAQDAAGFGEAEEDTADVFNDAADACAILKGLRLI